MERYNNVVKNDKYFSKYSKKFLARPLNGVIKTQAITEPRLRPDAESKVGALGFMLIMPMTLGSLLNLGHTIWGALLTLLCMVIGYKYFDRIRPFDTFRPLQEKNVAVGIGVENVVEDPLPV